MNIKIELRNVAFRRLLLFVLSDTTFKSLSNHFASVLIFCGTYTIIVRLMRHLQYLQLTFH